MSQDGAYVSDDAESCDHTNAEPAFDKVAATGMPAHEVRRRWPRFSGRCPDCGTQIIAYASFEHYIAGDW